VIDLHTLIALLTAIATATSPAQLDPERPATPSAERTCASLSSDHRGDGSDASDAHTNRHPEAAQPMSTEAADTPVTAAAGRESPTRSDGNTPDDAASDEDRPDDRSSAAEASPPETSATAEPDREATNADPPGRAQERHSPAAENADPRASSPECRAAEPDPAEPGRDDDATGTDRTTGHSRCPADVLDLTNWYLTLPTGADGDPDTVEQPDLDTYTSRYFQLNAAQDGVGFTANADGVTTKNSTYPRTELREMNGQHKAAWSNTTGVHTLRVTEAVTELPEAKPETVTAQIHDGSDDVLQIRLEGPRLMVQYDDGAKDVTLDPNYQLGTPYEIQIVAAEGHVQISYNGAQKADLPLAGSGWYFKAGAYLQSNTGKGEKASAVGQVVIYSLTVTHSP
jgi:hypothetical protein